MTKSPKGTADQQLTRAALFYDHAPTDGDVFGGGRREKIAALTELYPHVVMSPHVGGTIGDEVGRLADCVIEELEAWRDGRLLRYEVTREILATMG